MITVQNWCPNVRIDLQRFGRGCQRRLCCGLCLTTSTYVKIHVLYWTMIQTTRRWFCNIYTFVHVCIYYYSLSNMVTLRLMIFRCRSSVCLSPRYLPKAFHEATSRTTVSAPGPSQTKWATECDKINSSATLPLAPPQGHEAWSQSHLPITSHNPID